VRSLCLSLVVVLASASACRHFPVSFDDTAACREDLRASFGLVERNYAGYLDKVARIGVGSVERAQRQALERLADARSVDCAQVLNDWLAVFDEGHLGVADPQSAERSPDELEPSFEILSEDAAYLRVPSFRPEQRKALERLVRWHFKDIEARPDLIIDVRGNGGGNSSTFAILAELVYAQPVRMSGADVLATPENIAAWKRMLPLLHRDERRFTQRVIKRMEAQPGQWVNFFPDAVYKREAVLPMPARVAVLTDAGCGSACERFVLEAQHSPKVRLVGSATKGNLDYASMRPHPLPSGRMLWIGTTRAHGLPERSVDAQGIAPHIAMDPTRFDGATRRAAIAHVLHELREALGSLVTAAERAPDVEPRQVREPDGAL
jgi:hypothetical protein